MTILVTGAAGFIGSHLCQKLLEENKKVIGIDNLDPYYDVAIKENNLKLLTHPNFQFFHASITDYHSMKKIFQENKPQTIVHLAAKAGVRPSLLNPIAYEETNIRGTMHLLMLAKEFSIQKFISASSSSVYGENKKIPFSENDEVNDPMSVYAMTKRAGELLCKTYNHLYGIPMVCLRFFTVYGPRGRPDMAVYKFTKNIHEGKPIDIFGDGSMQRDYTYVDDIVQGIQGAMDYSQTPFEIFNLGNNKPNSISQLVSCIEQSLGKKAKINYLPIQAGDVPITYADISKAQKYLHFNPQTPLKEGINHFVEWYLESATK